jgi:Beta-1,3-glucanase
MIAIFIRIGSRSRPILIVVLHLMLVGSLLAANNIGLATIPLTINDNSGSGDSLYISNVGIANDTWYSVVDLEGNVKKTTHSSKPTSFAVDLGTAKSRLMKLPQLAGMRFYFSFGKPLLVNTSAEGIPGAPAGWVKGDVNFETLFDWAEFTWVTDPASGITTLNQAFRHYASGGLSVRPEDVEFVGMTIGSRLVFTQPETGATFQFDKPDTYRKPIDRFAVGHDSFSCKTKAFSINTTLEAYAPLHRA